MARSQVQMRRLIGIAVRLVPRCTQPGTGLGRPYDHSGTENSPGWKAREAQAPSRIPANSKKFLLSPSHHYRPRASLTEEKEGRRCQDLRPLRTVQFQLCPPAANKGNECWIVRHRPQDRRQEWERFLKVKALEKWTVKTLGQRVCYLKPGKRFTSLYVIIVTITAD